MSFSLIDAKAAARREMHAKMSYAATYVDETLAEPVDITVRFHNRLVRQADMAMSGMAEMLSAVERLLFNREDLAEAGLTLSRGGLVTLPDFDGAVFALDSRDAADGPITESWVVARQE